jgi:hypothetical protein
MTGVFYFLRSPEHIVGLVLRAVSEELKLSKTVSSILCHSLPEFTLEQFVQRTFAASSVLED